MNHRKRNEAAPATPQWGGLAGLLLARLRGKQRSAPRLELLERISLAPRQSLALVEAEGRRFLVATSQDGAPAFCALDRGPRPAMRPETRVAEARVSATRVSW